jgi:hypothetical protein
MVNQKKFDAVEMMRKIRDKLSNEYSKNPSLEDIDLKEIRNKYNIQLKTNENISLKEMA